MSFAHQKIQFPHYTFALYETIYCKLAGYGIIDQIDYKSSGNKETK